MRVARAIFQQLMTQGNMSTFYHWRQIRLLQGMSCARCVKLGFTFPDWNTSEHLCLRKLSKKLRNLWQRRSDCCARRHNFSCRCLNFLQASFLQFRWLKLSLENYFLTESIVSKLKARFSRSPKLHYAGDFWKTIASTVEWLRLSWNLIELN